MTPLPVLLIAPPRHVFRCLMRRVDGSPGGVQPDLTLPGCKGRRALVVRRVNTQRKYSNGTMPFL
jgi:hypothetical protein